MAQIYGAQDFAQDFNVSRETLERLSHYYELLRQWQKRVNLVGASTLDDFWYRHAADSAQILDFAPQKPHKWLDIGSGGGFPALIIALLRPDIEMHLVESDRRKVAFLEAVIRETGICATTHPCRAEDLALADIDMISARACAPLKKLIVLILPHFNKISTEALLHKGKSWQDELTPAQKIWTIDYQAHPSRFASDSRESAKQLEEQKRACILHLTSRPIKRKIPIDY